MLSSILGIVKTLLDLLLFGKKRGVTVVERKRLSEIKNKIKEVSDKLTTIDEEIRLKIANNEEVGMQWALKKSHKQQLEQLEEQLKNEESKK